MNLNIVSDEGKLVTAQVSGRVTQRSVAAGGEPLGARLGDGGYGRNVLLDMQQAEFLDSSGVSWLLVCHKRFRQAGGKLVLHSVPPLVDNVLQVLRMPLVLDIAADEASARKIALGESS